MSQIRIKTNEVKSINSSLKASCLKVANVKDDLGSLRYNIDSQITARHNIGYRLNNAVMVAGDIHIKLQNLEAFINYAMDIYDRTEEEILRLAVKNGIISTSQARYGWNMKSNDKNRALFYDNKWSPDAIKAGEAEGIVTEDGNNKKEHNDFEDISKTATWGAILDTAGQASVKIADATDSGFKIVRDGNYYIVKGSQEYKNMIGIKGTRYRVDTAEFVNPELYRYATHDTSTIKEVISNELTNYFWNPDEGKGVKGLLKSDFVHDSFIISKDDAILDKGVKALGYLGIAADVGAGIYDDINSQASASKFVSDATVNVAKGLGGMALATAATEVGAAIGTAIPIPVVGTVVGAAAGFAIGTGATLLYNYVTNDLKINGKSVAGWAETGLQEGIDSAAKEVKSLYNGAAKAVSDIGGSFKGAFAWI